MSKYLKMLPGLIAATSLLIAAAAAAGDGRFISASPSNVRTVEGAPDPVGERASRVGLLEVDFAQLYDAGHNSKPTEVPIPGRALNRPGFPGDSFP